MGFPDSQACLCQVCVKVFNKAVPSLWTTMQFCQKLCTPVPPGLSSPVTAISSLQMPWSEKRKTSRPLISTGLLQCSWLHGAALVPLPGKQAGNHLATPWQSQLMLSSDTRLDTALWDVAALPNHTKLKMSFGHWAAYIKEGLAANQCGNMEVPDS